MSRIFHPLLALIASATDRQLAKYVEYLKHENKILRARIPGQVHTRQHERERLLKYGKAIGRGHRRTDHHRHTLDILSVGAERKEWQAPKPKNPKGGQRKPTELRDLVLAIAQETGFGLTRIIGELRKLGIKKISRQTVRNILQEHGIQPCPDRTSDKWSTFIDRHAKTLWAVDFFSVRTVTLRGLKHMYVMVWLCMTTREMITSTSTQHPNSAWVEAQTGRISRPDCEPR